MLDDRLQVRMLGCHHGCRSTSVNPIDLKPAQRSLRGETHLLDFDFEFEIRKV